MYEYLKAFIDKGINVSFPSVISFSGKLIGLDPTGVTVQRTNGFQTRNDVLT